MGYLYSTRMSAAGYHVRRAIVDDLPSLTLLWNSMHLPAGELERRVTEFQVVESDDGNLLGAIGMQIVERHGLVHSEAFADFGLADRLRAQLWERLQSLATNRGLVRIWTAEAAPFWKSNGFHPAERDELKRLPPAWSALSRDWLTLPLRDEDALRNTLEMDFANLKRQEDERRQLVLSRAKMFRNIGIALVVVVVIVMLAFCITLLLHQSMLRRH